MQGVANPATGGTFASTYTIPQFQDCELLTPVISALVSGPGNTFVASFAPHGSPPPPAPSDPSTAPPAPLATIDAHGSVTVGGTPAGATTLPIDQHIEIPGPSTPPLITATPAPAPTTTTSPVPPVPLPPVPAPPVTALPVGTIGDLLGSLLGGG
jgi:hypothetical protein